MLTGRWVANDLFIGHARLRGSSAGGRAQCDKAFAAVRADDLGLAPDALLVVRHCSAHLSTPGRGPTSAPSLGGGVLQALAAQRASARRPWIDAAASQAPAVWFADEAEFHACLVRDMLLGQLRSHWWWRAVLGGQASADWLVRRTLPRGDLVAAILVRLAPRGEAVAWVQTWSDADAVATMHAVAAAHALPPASTAATTPVEGASLTREVRHWGHRSAPPVCGPNWRPVHEAMRDQADPAAEILQRWQAVAPELNGASLTVPQRRLLALSLAVRRAPRWARSAGFAAALQHCVTVGPTAAKPTRASLASLPPLLAGSGTPRPRPVPTAPRPLEPARAQRDEPAPLPLAAAVAGAQSTTAPAAALVPVTGQPTHAKGALAPNDYEQPGAPVSTQFGGAFYLLNALIALGFYGDFTQPRYRGIALSPWSALALLCEGWFGKDFEVDPLSGLLAQLEGRDQSEAAGAGFEPPDAWQLPLDCGLPWEAPRSAPWSAAAGRLQLWHPAGFALVDVRLSSRGASMAQALHWARQFGLDAGALRRRPAQPAEPCTTTPLARWRAHLSRYMSARLQRALNTGASTAPEDLVCRHAARVHHTDRAVEVHLSLAELPLPLRFAGLDRDPGWIPAAGRSVSFHFS